MAKALYICYFGFREPLVQTQVLPYLREVRKDDVDIALLTFEPNLDSKWTAGDLEAKKKELASAGIEWHVLPYHKRPSIPATAYDVFNGVRYVRRLLKKKNFDVLHARVHIPAMIAVLVRKFSRHKPKILFDIRGFVPEEYADAGVWKNGGLLFKLAKRVERWIMKESNGFVVLTEAAREVLFPESKETGYDKLNRPVEVIPCCVDFKKRFAGDRESLRAKVRSELNLHGRRVIIHVGSLVGLYLTPQIIEFLKVAKRRDPRVFALFLTQSDPKDIVSRLEAADFGADDFLVKKVGQEEVPAYLCASDLGLSFVKSSYATLSRSPTKIPEYLACGLPVIANSGVGDVDDLIKMHRLGAILGGFDEKAYEEALDDIAELADVSDRALATAHAEFDLENVAGKRYRRLYERLIPKGVLKTLYICYFGIREPLVQTQVLPYLREIQKARYLKADSADHSGREIRSSILTFEPEMSPDLGLMKKQLAEENIDLYCLPYHKRFSVIATSWDILRGAFFVRRFIARQRPDILHGRVHIATLMGALARKFSQHKPRLLFDIRGFFPEEYTDAGIWPAGGFLYWWAKRVERWLMTEADGFVVLTEKAREILFPESLESGFDRKGRPVEVIPCCVNLKMFGVDRSAYRDQIRMKIGAGNRPIVVYVGSFGGWYLSSSMINFFSAAREVDPETFVLILTQRDKENVKERLVKAGFDSDDFFVESVEPAEIPKFLAAADIAVSFIKACYSKQSSSPTKIAEYLASGLPVIANEGVGDVDDLIRERKVGHILQGLAPEDYKRAIEEIKGLSDVQDRCRALASTEFDLEQVGGARYRSIYENLLNGREKRP